MSLASRLFRHVGAAREEVLLVAPFMKSHVLTRLLDEVGPEVSLSVITRWRADEVAAGVSDLECRPMTLNRPGRFMLVDNLHAKYFRSDDEVLIGSANLTGKGLGLSQPANLELLVNTGVHPIFEAEALEAAWEPDDRYQREVAELAARLEVTPTDEGPPVDHSQPVHVAFWLPVSRQPEMLVHVYLGDGRDLSIGAARAAKSDLALLDLPGGLDAETFFDAVGLALRSKLVVRKLDGYLTKPRRFGDLRAWLEGIAELEREEAERSTQTLIRWVTFFLGHKYRLSRPRHTEVLERLE